MPFRNQHSFSTSILEGLTFYLDNELSTGNGMYLKVKVYFLKGFYKEGEHMERIVRRSGIKSDENDAKGLIRKFHS